MLKHVLHTTKPRFKQNTRAVLTSKKQRYKFNIVEEAKVTRIDSRKERAVQTDKSYISILGFTCISNLVVIYTIRHVSINQGVKNSQGWR